LATEATFERFAAQTLADFRQRGPLSIIEPEARMQQFLIDEARDAGRQPRPIVVLQAPDSS
jgi:hypothetical protein